MRTSSYFQFRRNRFNSPIDRRLYWLDGESVRRYRRIGGRRREFFRRSLVSHHHCELDGLTIEQVRPIMRWALENPADAFVYFETDTFPAISRLPLNESRLSRYLNHTLDFIKRMCGGRDIVFAPRDHFHIAVRNRDNLPTDFALRFL